LPFFSGKEFKNSGQIMAVMPWFYCLDCGKLIVETFCSFAFAI
jgi:hypothetical protein